MRIIVTLSLLAVLAVGCAHATTPPELVDARVAYANAGSAPGAALVPTDLAGARSALDAAEKSFAGAGDESSTRNLAYVANRRAIAAEAKARTAAALQQKESALDELERARRAAAAGR